MNASIINLKVKMVNQLEVSKSLILLNLKIYQFIIMLILKNDIFNNYSSIMRSSSSSSRFDKDYSTNFDYDSNFAESNFSFVQSIDEFDLEQSCLLRLKAQRQKIEQLTKLYEEKQRELIKKTEKQKKMVYQMERLTQLSAYREEWQKLKRQFDCLAKKYQSKENELINLKRQVQGIAVSTSDESQQYKKEIKYLKEQRLLSDAHWEAILSDKDEQLKKDARSAQERQYQLCQKVATLTERIEVLQQTLSEKQKQLERTKQEFRLNIMSRQEDLIGFEKVVQSFKKQNLEYKAKIISLQDSFEKERSQCLEALDQLKIQVKMYRKDQTEKENLIYEFKEIIKKSDTKNQALEQTVNSLKSNLKKFKENTDTSFKKITSMSEQERSKLETFIHELKSQLERQIEENAALYTEVKRLRGQLERKDHQEKQRKLLLMTEFREIDKMEKMVKKII